VSGILQERIIATSERNRYQQADEFMGSTYDSEDEEYGAQDTIFVKDDAEYERQANSWKK
jgi:hypothetical protein